MIQFLVKKIGNVTNYQNEILDLYDIAEYEGEEEISGRRFIRWRFIRELERNLTPDFMSKIREKVKTSFYARHIFSYQLRNIEEDSLIVMYTNIGSPWFERFSDAEKWLSEREKVRLDSDNINRPDTKWVFEKHFNVDVKVVLDRQPLLGTGPLPDWLRNLSHSFRHLQRQFMSLALYCGTPRFKTRSKYNGSTGTCKGFLQPQSCSTRLP